VVDVASCWPSVVFSIKGDASKIKVSPLWSACKRNVSPMMSPSHTTRFISVRLC
jgi:hypothetical protein